MLLNQGPRLRNWRTDPEQMCVSAVKPDGKMITRRCLPRRSPLKRVHPADENGEKSDVGLCE